MTYIEVVNGIIVGGNWKRFILIDPQGNEHKTWSIKIGDDAPKQLAIEYIKKRKIELGTEFIRLGWDGEWNLLGNYN